MDEENLVGCNPKKAKFCSQKMLGADDGGKENSRKMKVHQNSMEKDSQFTVVEEATTEYGEMECSLSWYHLPEPILVRILWLLSIKDMVSVSATCRRWYAIANDDFLWKQKLQKHFKIDPSIALRPGTDCWKSEYVRLRSHIPFIQTQCLNGHMHQVLHVSFSHNGEMFATCSKDGFVIIWNSAHPCTEKYSHNMKKFNWKYTQYSQFNQSDTLLLVSGVHFGSPHSTSGEIAVFTVDGKNDSHLRCRVINRPYDIFGTWFSDQYLISGDLHWLAQMVSTSVLWLNKANQEVDSEHVPIMYQLYKFYNRNASSVRAIMMAKCPWLDDSNDPLIEKAKPLHSSLDQETNKDLTKQPNTTSSSSLAARTGPGTGAGGSSSTSSSAGNPLSHSASLRRAFQISFDDSVNSMAASGTGGGPGSVSTPHSSDINYASNTHTPRSMNDSTIHYLEEYRNMTGGGVAGACTNPCMDESASSCCLAGAECINDDYDQHTDTLDEGDDEMENSIPKYLIFSTGSKTYTPHKVGIKRIRHVTFPKKLDPGPSLKERIAARRAAEQQNHNRDPDPDWWNYEAVADRFDKVDKVIDLHGHIIGMALSPDHRYLYVNTRPWPKNYVITNALEPPPIAQEIDIHVIDLMTLKPVGNMLKAHKAYTPSTECFFIFLDVCDDYVASGAEDMHAYLWDRYYGISLAKYKHIDVVNSVAFNPKDSEMLVTTSDDYTIKIWRSRAKVKQYNIDITNSIEAFNLKSSHFK